MSLTRMYSLGMAAADVARARLGGRSAEAARRRLYDRLTRLHGLPQKLAQLIAPFGHEQPDQPFPPCSIPFEQLLETLAEALGKRGCQQFRDIDPDGICASIGQVHRAELVDGRQAAVKVQYPAVADELRFDLQSLDWLSRPLGELRQGFDIAAYREELALRMREELDYRREAATLRWFRERAGGWPGLEIPEVVPECSCGTVLTTTWLAGDRIDATHIWPLENRAEAARLLLRLFFHQIFHWRRLHADPNPGNYRFRICGGRATVGLLDFGCVKDVEPRFATALADLLRAVQAGESSPAAFLEQFVEIGFQRRMLEPLADRLPRLARVMFEPLAVPGPFDIQQWQAGQRMAEILGEHRQTFRAAGSSRLLFVMRAYQGLLDQLTTLDAPVDWLPALGEVRPEFFTLPAPAAPRAYSAATEGSRQADRSESRAKHLRITVREAGDTRVALTFGAQAAEALPELMPPEVEEKLRDREIDVAAIARQAAADGFRPAELFSLDLGAKQVRVWLE